MACEDTRYLQRYSCMEQRMRLNWLAPVLGGALVIDLLHLNELLLARDRLSRIPVPKISFTD